MLVKFDSTITLGGSSFGRYHTIQSSLSARQRQNSSLSSHCIALLVVDASLPLLDLDRILDILGPCISVHHAKYKVYLFERKLLRLWDEDPNKYRHGQAEDGEHQECTPANAVDGGGGDLRNDEVKEPLGGS